MRIQSHGLPPGWDSVHRRQAPSSTTRDAFSEALSATTAARAPDSSSSSSLLASLTPSDRQLVEVSTGFRISADGVVQNPRPDRAVDPFIVNVAADRRRGTLQGEVTGSYLVDLFAAYDAAGTPFNPDYLTKALEHLRRPAGERRGPSAAFDQRL